jgi:hypothetical protein
MVRVLGARTLEGVCFHGEVGTSMGVVGSWSCSSGLALTLTLTPWDGVPDNCVIAHVHPGWPRVADGEDTAQGVMLPWDPSF